MNHESLFQRAFAGLVIAITIFSAATTRAGVSYAPANLAPPEVRREFRGAWIATVENIDWPSKPGLPSTQQKQELIAQLDRAVKLHLNTIILQVRPACDALYNSQLEPWSYYVSGTMGKPPQPYYDPLEFAVTEAHKRGLELHAWFNPFRAFLYASKAAISANHISKTHPELVVHYGKFLWLDPGEKAAQDYSLRVVMDVVRRYDIDGVHFDDYFYPYKEKDEQKREMDFPDGASWKKYVASGGDLSHDNWRRANVDEFVQHVHDSIKATKPWVKFGIAPFGIWQPGYPEQIKGFNAYDVLYCDSRKWLNAGWLDYCSPQLYWAIDAPEQSFPVLLRWWNENNPRGRNLWPGLDSERVGGKWKPGEIVQQIKITREQNPSNAGSVHWDMKALMTDKGGLATDLAQTVYNDFAIVPPSPWLDPKPPVKPQLIVDAGGRAIWKPVGDEKISLWLVQTKFENRWRTSIFPGNTYGEILNHTPEYVAVTGIDRCGVATPPAVMRREYTPGN